MSATVVRFSEFMEESFGHQTANFSKIFIVHYQHQRDGIARVSSYNTLRHRLRHPLQETKRDIGLNVRHDMRTFQQ